MTLQLNVLLSPRLLMDESILENSIAIVIDIFRATTTIATALEQGAKEIVPVATLAEAEAKTKELRGRFGEASVLLCGERGGLKPTGFDLGNSPLEYTRETVEGKILILSTSNGTLALQAVKAAPLVLAASFANMKHVVNFVMKYLILREARALQNSDEQSPANNRIDRIHLVCAGSNGEFSYEDTLCAGALIDALAEELTVGETDFTCTDSAKAARLLFRAENNLAQTLVSTLHAEYLRSIGFGEDVEFCVQANTSRMVPLRRADGALVHWHNPLNL
jgi:2-phosphosulfolactate phosphatase